MGISHTDFQLYERLKPVLYLICVCYTTFWDRIFVLSAAGFICAARIAKKLLFADAVEISGGTDEQSAISDSNRRLNGRLLYFCLEDNFELIGACGEHYDFAGFVDTVEFVICAGQ